jgi:hypothetical protein
MILFDYLYYRFCKFYYSNGDRGARISSLAVISLFQLFNIFTVFILISLFFYKDFLTKKSYIAFICVALIIINGFRYNRLDYDLLNEKWGKEDDVKKRKKTILLAIYIIGSTIICISLAIFHGSNK